MRSIIPNATVEAVRALVVSNMLPDAARPERGRFVRDQVAALRALPNLSPGERPPEERDLGVALRTQPSLDVELFEFAPGARSLIRAARMLRSRYGGERFDVVHAHFGLSAYPALAVRARIRGVTLHGTDVSHPRTRLLTRAVLPAMDLVGAASQSLVGQVPGARARLRARALPCGVDMDRFEPIERGRAREALGLDAARSILLLPADATRPEKRGDRAQALAEAVDAELLTLGGVAPERVPLYVNAADAVVIPSEREGFGLAALEALACDVPVLATPVGVHAEALAGVEGCLCAPFELGRWEAILRGHLAAEDARIRGRERAARWSCERMAQQLAQAWSSLLAGG